MVVVVAVDGQEAADALEQQPNLERLEVQGWRGGTRQHPGQRRFIAALERHLSIECIEFDRCSFDAWNDEDAERLFQDILPNHPTLNEISVQDCRIPSQNVEMFATSLSNRTRPLSRLRFIRTPLTPQRAASIANMIGRNAPIQLLGIRNCGVDYKLICDSLPDNSHLQRLELYDLVSTINSDTIIKAVGTSSPLRHLEIRAKHWKLEAVKSLVEALETNTVLEELTLNSYHIEHVPLDLTLFGMLEDLLTYSNFTLRRIRLIYRFSRAHQRERIDALLRQNAVVRSAHNQLHSQNYHLEQMSHWSRAMGKISSKPTLIYRFLRHGNLDAFANHLVQGTGGAEPIG